MEDTSIYSKTDLLMYSLREVNKNLAGGIKQPAKIKRYRDALHITPTWAKNYDLVKIVIKPMRGKLIYKNGSVELDSLDALIMKNYFI